MQLIGMLDSPYVRRVAISLRLLKVDFEHRPVSVFRTFDEFRAINPVVKAPTLVCDNGEVLMDSTLIIDYVEHLVGRSLMPADAQERQRATKVVGLALAACEKSVQIVYERTLRPTEKQHEPWLTRVKGQLLAAYSLLEREAAQFPAELDEGRLTQAELTAAVAWSFTQLLLPGEVSPDAHPALAAHAARAEQLDAFRALPQV